MEVVLPFAHFRVKSSKRSYRSQIRSECLLSAHSAAEMGRTDWRCSHCDPSQLILSITPKNCLTTFLQTLSNNLSGPEGNAYFFFSLPFWCRGSNLLAQWLFVHWSSCSGVERASPPCSFHSSSRHCLSCSPSSLLLPRCSHLENS